MRKLTYPNYDPPSTKEYINKHVLAPKWPFRLLICGPSGCGKTNLLLYLVYELLYYDRIYFYARDFNEDKYEKLLDFFDLVHDKIKKKYKKDIKIATFSSDISDMSIDDLDSEHQNLIVFDDCVTEKDQKNIEELFIRGRKKNASVIYLTQSYFDVPKIIRLQCNYLALFDIADSGEMREIQKVHAIDKNTFNKYYREATKTPFSFFFIDKRDKTYRRNFDHFLNT